MGRWSDDKYEFKVSTTAGLGDVEIEPNNSQQEATDLENEALPDNYFPRMTKTITKFLLLRVGKLMLLLIQRLTVVMTIFMSWLEIQMDQF